jgi:hypothetical protein
MGNRRIRGAWKKAAGKDSGDLVEDTENDTTITNRKWRNKITVEARFHFALRVEKYFKLHCLQIRPTNNVIRN